MGGSNYRSQQQGVSPPVTASHQVSGSQGFGVSRRQGMHRPVAERSPYGSLEFGHLSKQPACRFVTAELSKEPSSLPARQMAAQE